MSELHPVELSAQDLEILELMRTANEQYQVYLDMFERQSRLTPKRQPQAVQSRSWDYTLELKLRSESNAFMERFTR